MCEMSLNIIACRCALTLTGVCGKVLVVEEGEGRRTGEGISIHSQSFLFSSKVQGEFF